MQQSDGLISDEILSSHDTTSNSGSWNPALRPDSNQSPEVKSHKANDFFSASHDESDARIEKKQDIYDRKIQDTQHTPQHQDISHVSSLSFARTVSHDGFWADEEESDPTWEASPLENAFASIKDSKDRTNSFPNVPPTHDPSSTQSPLSQRPLENESSFDTDQSRTTELDNNAYVAGDHVDHINVSNSSNFTDRYEEGVPLVNGTSHSEPHIDNSKEESGSSVDPFAGSAVEEDDFFGTASHSEDFNSQVTRQPEIQRKSTSQVIGALKYPSYEEAHRNEIGERHLSVEPSSSGQSAPGKEDHALPSGNEHSNAEISGKIDSDTKEDDLAEMWKAALDDDEILDSTGEAVDPAPFFEDDGEGFLEDDDVPDLSTQQVTHVPPLYQNIRQNGHPRGLAGLSTMSHGALNTQYKSSEPSIPYAASSMAPPYNNRSMSTVYGNNPAQAPYNQGIQEPGKSALQSFSARMDLPRGSNSAPYGSSGMYQPTPPENRPELSKAQSFADKAKGGYSSPYDLPMDVIKPRKRQSMQQLTGHYHGQTNASSNSLPPRATLPQNNQPPLSSAPYSLSSASSPSLTNRSPPRSSSSNAPFMKQGTASAPSLKPRSSTASFFEDLPVAAKTRPIHSSGRNTSQASQVPAQSPSPYAIHPPVDQPQTSSMAMPPPPTLRASSSAFPGPQHQAPDRVNSNAQPLQQHSAPPPGSASRYSPAPTQTRSDHASPSKPSNYGGNYVQSNSLPHQPRTSSPLAHPHRSSIVNSSVFTVQPDNPPSSNDQREQHAPNLQGQSSQNDNSYNHGLLLPKDYDALSMQSSIQSMQGMPRPSSDTSSEAPAVTSNRYAPRSSSQGLQRVASSSSFVAPPKLNRASSNYAPIPRASSSLAESSFVPPQRSQTQSPGNTMTPGPKLSSMPQDPYQRPASVHDPTSPTSGSFSYPNQPQQSTQNRARAFSQSLKLIVPTDGREHDPLGRWKGCPIFSWGFGGNIVSCFPSESPMYTSGQAMLKRGLGEVKVRSAKNVLPLAEHSTSFPGPLKAKNKKKEVVAWLSKRIEQLEREIPGFRPSQSSPDSLGEKILLWKVMRAFVENDGTLEGNSQAEQTVRALVLPGSIDQESDLLLGSTGPVTQISSTAISEVPSDARNLEGLNALRKLLLSGDREKAVWHAADQRLWAHAMLISSTMNRDIWKNVAREFISKEVQGLGNNTESLAALYEIFAGNWDESVDKLVHPSARMGVQMLSTPGKAPKDTLEGLSKWRETLGLVVSNRSPEDSKALLALGRLLETYDRIDAAHTCYIFGRSAANFGPNDDPQTAFSLVGIKQSQGSPTLVNEMDSILLSEVYEFALSLGTAATISSAPHLQAYKLDHALMLAEYGFRGEALQYCSAIANTIKSSTKSSPYFNSVLVTHLEDLTLRLQHSPQDGSSSWVSKPSMEKVSGVFSAKFYSFINGDDSDAASTGSGKEAADVGPFARIAGNTPPMTRNTSNANLYDGFNPAIGQPYSAGPQSPVAATTNTRFVPTGSYNSYQPLQSSPERQRKSLDSPRTSLDRGVPQAPSYGMYDNTNAQPSSYSGSPYEPIQQPLESPLGIAATSPRDSQFTSVNTSVPNNTSYNPHPTHSNVASEFPSSASSYVPSALSNEYQALQSGSGYEPVSAPDTQESTSRYEPSSYEPPSYQPYIPEEENSNETAEESKPKKSIMDLDDDDDKSSARAAKAKSKAEKDREAEENFRKAAEADAQKDSQSAPKKGWFSGWLGKKDPSASPGPIRAKLGEESSFHYDPELKKWVNKKAGTPTPTASATPPPPRGTAGPRSVSGPSSLGRAPGPPPGPPSTRPTPLSQDALRPSPDSSPNPTASNQPPSGSVTPARIDSPSAPGLALQGLAPGSGPPSRPSTGMSNASSIDDLLGPAGTARKGGTTKKAKKGRGYVDVMAKS